MPIELCRSNRYFRVEYLKMSKKRKKPDEPIINIFNKKEIEKWCLEFDCTKEALINAVLTSGKSVKKVREFLKTKNKKKK